MEKFKNTILHVLHQCEDTYPKYKNIIKKIEKNEYLNEEESQDIILALTAAVQVLTDNLNKAEVVMRQQEDLLHKYEKSVNNHQVLVAVH